MFKCQNSCYFKILYCNISQYNAHTGPFLPSLNLSDFLLRVASSGNSPVPCGLRWEVEWLWWGCVCVWVWVWRWFWVGKTSVLTHQDADK